MEDINKIKELSKYCLNCKTKPCSNGCPLGNNIPGFIKNIKEEKYEEAYNILSETTVLPAICGKICPHSKQCQGSCVRGIKQLPVQIGTLEAFLGDITLNNNFPLKKSDNDINKKIAVVGGGPCGLTCAAFLARQGYNVTIFEKHDYLGGLLIHGIPDFRLDKLTVKNSIKKILNLGINVQLNTSFGKDIYLEDLKQKFDAIFLSFGANLSCKMGIDGENLNGVLGANELLEKNNHPNYSGKKIAIIGGGNVAMDTARTIKRMGAKEVYVIYRRSEKQMPAEDIEIQEAKKDKIEFLFQTNIIKAISDNGISLNKIECIKTELVKKENEAREVPIDIENSNFIMDIDFLIIAIGSKPEKDLLNSLNLSLNKWGYIDTDENCMTSQKGIFAGGDLSGTKSTVAWAARAGRNAAYSINKYLSK